MQGFEGTHMAGVAGGHDICHEAGRYAANFLASVAAIFGQRVRAKPRNEPEFFCTVSGPNGTVQVPQAAVLLLYQSAALPELVH